MNDEKLHQQLDELLELTRMNARNIQVLYQRTTMLAFMIESLDPAQELRVPKILRAEIDASMDPESFEQLALQDKDEFLHRYGEIVLKVLQTQGIKAITKLGDLAPGKQKVIN